MPAPLLLALALLAGAPAVSKSPSPKPPSTSSPTSETTHPGKAGGEAGKEASTETIRYLALGDSFTEGTGSSPEQSFPARLAAAWRAEGKTVELKNLGVNGYTTQNLLDRELPEVAGFKPTRVTLAIGANDLVRGSDDARYRAQVKRILKGLAKAGVKMDRVVALPQPDWSLSPAAAAFGEPAELRARIERFNAILREETEAAGGRYVDLFPLMRKQAEAGQVAEDGLHPDARAYGEWANALQKAIPAP